MKSPKIRKTSTKGTENQGFFNDIILERYLGFIHERFHKKRHFRQFYASETS